MTSGLDQSFPLGSLQKAAGPWAAIKESSAWSCATSGGGEEMVPGQRARTRPGPGEAAGRAEEPRNTAILTCDKGHLWRSTAGTFSRKRARRTNVPVKSSALIGRLENGGTLGQRVSSGFFYLVQLLCCPRRRCLRSPFARLYSFIVVATVELQQDKLRGKGLVHVPQDLPVLPTSGGDGPELFPPSQKL